MSKIADFWFADVDWSNENHRSSINALYHKIYAKDRSADNGSIDDALSSLALIASDGSLAASLYLAIYYDRLGNASGHENALKWYKFSAKLGSRAAAFRAAKMQLDREIDVSNAEEVLWRLSKEGFGPAQYRLAHHLLKKDKSSNRSVYLQLLSQSAREGHFFAKRDLGTAMLLEFPNLPRVFSGIYLIGSGMVDFLWQAAFARKNADIYYRIHG